MPLDHMEVRLTALALPAVELRNVKRPTEAETRTLASGKTYVEPLSRSVSSAMPRPSSIVGLTRGSKRQTTLSTRSTPNKRHYELTLDDGVLIVAVRIRRISRLALALVVLCRARLVEPEQMCKERRRVAPPCEEEQEAAADVYVRRRRGPRRDED